MANKIQIKRGLKASLPTLNVGEPALCTDTEEFYIGKGTRNIKIINETDLTNGLSAIPKIFRNEKIKSNSDFLVSQGTGLQPLGMNFDLIGVNTSENLTIPIYEENFNRPVNYAGSELFTELRKTTNNVTFTSTDWALRFKNTGEEDEMILKSFITMITPNVDISIKIHSIDDLSSARVGLAKDANNWVLANIDELYKSCEIVYMKDGSFKSVGGTYVDIKPLVPCELHFQLYNNVAIGFIKELSNGKTHLLNEFNTGGVFDFTNKDILRVFAPCVGARVKTGNNLVLKDFKVGYTSGMSFGSDFKIITYEDGNPIRVNGNIYFTGTTHSTTDISGNGTNVFKMNTHSLKIEFVGKIASEINGKIINLGSPKVFYDRNIKKFVYVATSFAESPCKTYIGSSTNNLLSGINIVGCQLMNIPSQSVGTWDIDVIYDSSISKYRTVYTGNGTPRQIILAETTDILGTWTEVKRVNTSTFGEGSVFTRIGGKYYITHVSSKSELDVRDYSTLAKTTKVNCNIWSGNQYTGDTPMPWGCIFPIQNGNYTHYYMINFSMRRWEGREYSYGDLWLYKAREHQYGQEYKNEDVLFFD